MRQASCIQPEGNDNQAVGLRLVLPFPPSANRYYRHIGYRTLISREGRAFREEIRALLAGDGPRKPPSGGRIALCMDAFPPDRRRRDIDNLQKASVDALQHAGAYKDDSQIDLLVTRRCEVSKPGRIEVQLYEFPLACCPLCGGPFQPEDN